MITILNRTDFTRNGSKLSAPFTGIVRRELSQLLQLLDSEGIDPLFRIDTAGYQIVCLEDKESDDHLASIGLTSTFHQVEYVELHEAYTVQFYRILLMHDNECFTIVLSLKDSQNAQLEGWFLEQCGVGEG